VQPWCIIKNLKQKKKKECVLFLLLSSWHFINVPCFGFSRCFLSIEFRWCIFGKNMAEVTCLYIFLEELVVHLPRHCWVLSILLHVISLPWAFLALSFSPPSLSLRRAHTHTHTHFLIFSSSMSFLLKSTWVYPTPSWFCSL
jgi:hypothetical protein